VAESKPGGDTGAVKKERVERTNSNSDIVTYLIEEIIFLAGADVLDSKHLEEVGHFNMRTQLRILD